MAVSMARIEFVFFDAGGGHRAAVTALEAAIAARGLPWDVHSTNLQVLLDRLDPLNRLAGVRVQDSYNAMLRTGWTLGSTELLRLLQTSVRLLHKPIVNALAVHWAERRPDLLVSCVPNFNRELRESFARAFPGRPFATILTDFADFPPHFWIEREPQHFICGTERAVTQARAMGHPPEHVHRVSGMILHPRFYQTAVIDRRRERQRLGLDPDKPTGLVLFGGHGSAAMKRIARRLDRSGLEVQLILICGRNERLARELRRERSRMARVVEGFTTRVSDYMQMADFLIGKPGPGSLSEALAKRLPVIVASNAWTLPQERYNAEWVVERQVGMVLPNFRAIVPAVERLIQPETLARLRANASRLELRALFQIPDVLASILAAREPAPISAFPNKRSRIHVHWPALGKHVRAG
jgi:1,2-diacylglycerol 3-beta-galactosyltransferase